MRPTFGPHDALLVKPVALDKLVIGMIVTYRSAVHPGELVSHRIVALDTASRRVQTQGDNLSVPDPWISRSTVLGQATVKLPVVGWLLDELKQPLGLAVAVYLPAAAILSAECRRLARAGLPPVYQLHSHTMV